MKEEPQTEVCTACDGDGKEYYSCCGDDVKGTQYADIGICPTCKEHLGGEETCDLCDGKGYLDELDIVEQQHNRECDKADNSIKHEREGVCPIGHEDYVSGDAEKFNHKPDKK